MNAASRSTTLLLVVLLTLIASHAGPAGAQEAEDRTLLTQEEMTSIIKEYNSSQSDVEVRGIFTGDYDTTKIKAESAAKAGNPPALAIMMANLTTDLVLNDFLLPIQEITSHGGIDAKQFLSENYWPALHKNAMVRLRVRRFVSWLFYMGRTTEQQLRIISIDTRLADAGPARHRWEYLGCPQPSSLDSHHATVIP